MSASQPPLAPSPNCGSPSIQPSPGAKISVCASGTKKNHDNTSAVAAGTRVSPAPRRQKPAPQYRPSNTWYAAAGHSSTSPSATTSPADSPPLLTNSGSTHGPTTMSNTAMQAMSAAHSTMTREPSLLAHSRLPAPIDWPTSVVPA